MRGLDRLKVSDVVTNGHLEYLDRLRQSGVTNMFEAAPYLVAEFDLLPSEAILVLAYWMVTFSERHSQEGETGSK